MPVYTAGQSLAVTFTKANIAPEDTEVLPAAAESVTLAIVALIEPFSNSATMCVRVNKQTDNRRPLQGFGLDPEATYFLKLYDRRCVSRRRHCAYLYDSDLEAEFRQWLGNPNRTMITYESLFPYWEEANYPEGEDRAVVEDWQQYKCGRDFAQETQIYRTLQGDKSKAGLHPQFFGTVELQTPIGPVCGIVLEFIGPLLTLHDLLDRVGACGYMSSLVDDACKSAMSTLARLNDDYILNEDLKTVDVLIQLSTSRAPAWPANGVFTEEIKVSRCVLVDFAEARLRYPDETDFEWLSAKNGMDEDGALQHPIKLTLRQAREFDCRYHGQSCRDREAEAAADEADREFQKGLWERTIRPQQRFPLNLTPEQIRIARVFLNYGLYEYRPHPQTVEEAQRRQEALDLSHEPRKKLRFPFDWDSLIYEIAGVGVIGRGILPRPPPWSGVSFP